LNTTLPDPSVLGNVSPRIDPAYVEELNRRAAAAVDPFVRDTHPPIWNEYINLVRAHDGDPIKQLSIRMQFAERMPSAELKTPATPAPPVYEAVTPEEVAQRALLLRRHREAVTGKRSPLHRRIVVSAFASYFFPGKLRTQTVLSQLAYSVTKSKKQTADGIPYATFTDARLAHQLGLTVKEIRRPLVELKKGGYVTYGTSPNGRRLVKLSEKVLRYALSASTDGIRVVCPSGC
jgi:hypothetical protein